MEDEYVLRFCNWYNEKYLESEDEPLTISAVWVMIDYGDEYITGALDVWMEWERRVDERTSKDK